MRDRADGQVPEWRDEIRRRLQTARLGGTAEADIVEELAHHLDDRYAELRARGESEADARGIVLLELEDEQTLGRRVRQAKRTRPDPVALGADAGAAGAGGVRGILGGIVADVRIGLRMLARAPAFTIVATLVIALAIGANTAVFSVVNTLLLRPLPGVRAPGELAMIYTSDYSGPIYSATAYPDYEAMRESGAFAGIAVYQPQPFSVGIDDRAVQLIGEMVSADYFNVLGVRPAAGRFFVGEEAGTDGQAPVVVISHNFWQTRLNGAPDVVGRSLRVNGQILTIVGVAPPAYRGMLRGLQVDIWVPTSSPVAAGNNYSHRGNRGLFVVARMHENATIAATQERLNVLAGQLHAAYPDTWTDINNRSRVLTVLPESESRLPRQVLGPVVGMAALLMAVVAVVLLIACSNVANLLLTRASARRAEMGVRVALGATRGRIIRQLLAESVLLASLGGVAGVLLGVWITQSLDRVPLPGSITIDVSLDGRVVLFAAAITVLTGVLFGLAPALHGASAPAPLMREGARGGNRARVRNALVVVQVAASVVLLVGGALFLRSLIAAQRIDTGMDTENMALIPFDLRTEGYSLEQAQQFYAQMQEQAAALPGVTSATLAQRVPLGGGFARRGIGVDDYTPGEGEDMEINFNVVSPGYFDAMGIRVVRGRGFTDADRDGAPHVVVVNEAFARRFWPGTDALGRRVRLAGSDGPLAEVVGVVPDGKYRSLTEEPLPYMYYPYLQWPAASMMLQVRTAIEPAAITDPLRQRVRALAPTIPVPEVTTLRSHVGIATMPQRIAAMSLAVLGVLALGIAAIGLYGVVSYVVVQRTHEIGIRTALGAAAADVARMVVMQGMRLALIGVAIGAVLALVLARLLSTMLFVSPADPLAIAGTAVLLTVVAAVASWLPARRAARVDPLTALRSD
ncbi:MAG TPA: ABC transporter permease [Longimicrobiales bacterium]|nr:ABC transporter permease [Longimicrobiales bacterium]